MVYTQNIDCLENKTNLSREKIVFAHGNILAGHCSNAKCNKDIDLELLNKNINEKSPKLKQETTQYQRNQANALKLKQPKTISNTKLQIINLMQSHYSKDFNTNNNTNLTNSDMETINDRTSMTNTINNTNINTNSKLFKPTTFRPITSIRKQSLILHNSNKSPTSYAHAPVHAHNLNLTDKKLGNVNIKKNLYHSMNLLNPSLGSGSNGGGLGTSFNIKISESINLYRDSKLKNRDDKDKDMTEVQSNQSNQNNQNTPFSHQPQAQSQAQVIKKKTSQRIFNSFNTGGKLFNLTLF